MRKKIIVLGGSGLIGSHLIPKLLIQGYQVLNMDLQALNFRDENYQYKNIDILKSKLKAEDFQGSKAIINLVGYPINKRWNHKNLELIYNSRVLSSQKIAKLVDELDSKPFLVISASGVTGYKPDTKHNSEDSQLDQRFIGKLIQDWEEPILKLNIRNVCLRQAFVLSPQGGYLQALLKPFRFSIAIKLGSGKQKIPFIHIDDLCQIYIEAINNEKYHGIINAVSPEKINFDTLIAEIDKIKHPFLHIRIPTFLIKLIYQDFADELSNSIEANPDKLSKLKFKFNFSHLNTCLLNLLKPKQK